MRKALWFLLVAILLPAAAVLAAGNASKTMPGDAEALATLAAVDQHEIAVAKQAEGKGVMGNVLDFAKRMESDHGKNLDDTRRVARENKLPLSSSASIRAMEAKGRADMQAMAKLSGAAYSKAYVDEMVKGHTEVLAKLDALIPDASDPEVIAHLKATREAVAMHLEAAKALQ